MPTTCPHCGTSHVCLQRVGAPIARGDLIGIFLPVVSKKEVKMRFLDALVRGKEGALCFGAQEDLLALRSSTSERQFLIL